MKIIFHLKDFINLQYPKNKLMDKNVIYSYYSTFNFAFYGLHQSIENLKYSLLQFFKNIGKK